MILVKNLKSPFCKLGLEIVFDDLVRKQVLLDYLNTNFANCYKTQSVYRPFKYLASQLVKQTVNLSVNWSMSQPVSHVPTIQSFSQLIYEWNS